MLTRWLRRRRWRRSAAFEEAVEAGCKEMCDIYGQRAIEIARRKHRRRKQPPRRKMVWGEVVKRLETGQTAEAIQSCGEPATGTFQQPKE